MAEIEANSGPVGIGGWMYLFLFGFAVAGPLKVVISSFQNLYSDPQVAATFGDSWTAYQFVEWVLLGASLALTGYVVWRLYNRPNWQTVQITIGAIPILTFGITAIDLILTSWWLDIEIGLLAEGLGRDVFRGAVYCSIWCSYFAVSKRVRNTYPKHVVSRLETVFD